MAGMDVAKCKDCQPASSNIENASDVKTENVLDPSTFIKPDLKSEVHVVIEYCNRWYVTPCDTIRILC